MFKLLWIFTLFVSSYPTIQSKGFEFYSNCVNNITDKNFDKLVGKTGLPWLINFYRPTCGACVAFSTTWKQIAEEYNSKDTNNMVYFGSMNIDENEKWISFGIEATPTIKAFNFVRKDSKNNDNKQNMEMIGAQKIDDIKLFIKNLFKTYLTMKNPSQYKKKESSKDKKGNIQITYNQNLEKTKNKIIINETLAPMDSEENKKIRRLLDAASSFIFILHKTIFKLTMADMKKVVSFISVVSKHFPGESNRFVLFKLYDSVTRFLNHKNKTNSLAATNTHTDFNTTIVMTRQEWLKIVLDWQIQSSLDLKQFHNEKNQKKSIIIHSYDIFRGVGNHLYSCTTITCAQWQLFHMMSANYQYNKSIKVDKNHTNNNYCIEFVNGIYHYVSTFFSCYDCRNHFIQYHNKNQILEKANSIKYHQSNEFLLFWLWELHNDVNNRLEYQIVPSINECPTCHIKNGWNKDAVRKWLLEIYSYEQEKITVNKIETIPKNNETNVNSAQKFNYNFFSSYTIAAFIIIFTFIVSMISFLNVK